MIAAMDPSVDPCDDFYRYSCGRWSRADSNPDGLWADLSELERESLIVVKQILGLYIFFFKVSCFVLIYSLLLLFRYLYFWYTEQPLETLLNDAERNAQRFYQSCKSVHITLATAFRTKGGMQSFLELLGKIHGWQDFGFETPTTQRPNYSDHERKQLEIVSALRKHWGKMNQFRDFQTEPSQPFNKLNPDGWNFQKSIQAAHNIFNSRGIFHWSVVPDSSARYVIKVNMQIYRLNFKRSHVNITIVSGI